MTPAQLALAWLLHQGQDIFPIPGTRRAERIDENAKAADIRLEPEKSRRRGLAHRLDTKRERGP
ncbi:MAG: aldo/keto reductase [Gammaproteobacteria bacterium]